MKTLAIFLVLFNCIYGMVTFPPLGSTISYALFANLSVISTGFTIAAGDVGAGVEIVGFPPGITTAAGGIIPVGSPTNAQCYADALILDAALEAEGPAVELFGDLSLQAPLPAGVYFTSHDAFASGAGLLPLVLDGGGDENAVWVFQIHGSLFVQSFAWMAMNNSGSACNVFWRIRDRAELHSAELWIGSLIAQQDIIFDFDSDLIGTAISLQRNIFLTASNIVPCCEAACTCECPGPTTGAQTTGITIG